MVYFGGFFAKLGYFAGFSLHIINFVGRISEAALKGVGDIFFINLEPSERVHSHIVIFCWFFLDNSPQGSAKLLMGVAEVGGHIVI